MARNYQLTWLLVILLCVVVSESAQQSTLVTQLPGFNGTFPSKHYSGYVTIDEKHGKKLFYYFVESEETQKMILLFSGSMMDPDVPVLMALPMSMVLKLSPRRKKRKLTSTKQSWKRRRNSLPGTVGSFADADLTESLTMNSTAGQVNA